MDEQTPDAAARRAATRIRGAVPDAAAESEAPRTFVWLQRLTPALLDDRPAWDAAQRQGLATVREMITAEGCRPVDDSVHVQLMWVQIPRPHPEDPDGPAQTYRENAAGDLVPLRREPATGGESAMPEWADAPELAWTASVVRA